MEKLLDLIRSVVRAIIVRAIREMIQGLVVGLITGLTRLVMDALAERFGAEVRAPSDEDAPSRA